MRAFEGKIYAAYNEDGLLDILIGATLVLFALSTLTRLSFLASVATPLMIIALGPIRKALSEPRLGEIEASDNQLKDQRKQKSLLILYFSITLLMGIGTFVLFANGASSAGDAAAKLLPLENLPLTLLLAFTAAGLTGVGVKLDLKRYFAYATLAILAISIAMSGMLAFKEALLSTGVLILAGGIFMLVRFLVKYPRIETGDMDDFV